MKRLALILALIARAATALPPLTEPLPLTPGVLGPTPHEIRGAVAAANSDGYLVVWFDLTTHAQRIGFDGALVGDPLNLGAIGAPRAITGDGHDFLLITAVTDSSLQSVRLSADGRATIVDRFKTGYAPSDLQLETDGRGFLLVSEEMFTNNYVRAVLYRFDAGGHLAEGNLPGPGLNGNLVVLAGRYVYIDATFNGVVARSVDDPSVPATPLIFSSGFFGNAHAAAGPQELAVVFATAQQTWVAFFDAQLRWLGNDVLLDVPRTVPVSIVWDGSAFLVVAGERVFRVARGSATVVAHGDPFGRRVAGGAGGALVVSERSGQVAAALVTHDGAREEQIVSRAEPDQEAPVLFAAGNRIGAAWIETDAVATRVLAALFDRDDAHIVAGPVAVTTLSRYPGSRWHLAASSDGVRMLVGWRSDYVVEGGLAFVSANLAARPLETYLPVPYSIEWNGREYVLAGMSGYPQIVRLSRNGDLLDNSLRPLLWPNISTLSYISSVALIDGNLLLMSTITTPPCTCGTSYEADVARLDAIPPTTVLATYRSGGEPFLGGTAVPGGVLLLFAKHAELLDVRTLAALDSQTYAEPLPAFDAGDGVVRFGDRVVGVMGTGSNDLAAVEFDLRGNVIASSRFANAHHASILAAPRLAFAYETLAPTDSRRIVLRFAAPPHRAAQVER